MDKPKIRYTLLSQYSQYLDGDLCGEQIMRDHLDEDRNEVDTANKYMKAGSRFEYLAGITDREVGQVLTPTGRLASNNSHIESQAALFKTIRAGMENDGFIFDDFQRNLKVEFDHYTLTGTIDFTVYHEKMPRRIIDAKFTGAFEPYNANSDYAFSKEIIKTSEKMQLQPIFYLYLDELLTGKSSLFEYWCFHSKNEEFKRLTIDVTESTHTKMVKKIHNLADSLVAELSLGRLQAYPNYERCKKCPLRPNNENGNRPCELYTTEVLDEIIKI